MNLENRIAELEKQTKIQRLGIFSLGIMLVSAILLAMTSQSADSLTASSLTILNKEGKPAISISDEGLAFLDAKGIARIGMGVNPEDKSVGLAFMDNNSAPRVAIGTNDAGEAGITLIAAGIREIMSGSTWPAEKKQ